MHEAETAQPETTSPTSVGGIPQVGIRHLFILTTLAAVFFAIERASEYWTASSPGASQSGLVARQTSTLLYHVVNAAAATGVITLLMNRDAKGHAFRASGHWVILAHIVSAITWLPVRFILTSSPNASNWIMPLFTVTGLVLAVAYGLIGFMNRGRWRWLFGARAALALLGAGVYLLPFFLAPYQYANQYAVILLLLVTLGFLVHETINGKYRDWPHFLGIVTVVLSVGSSVFWHLARLSGWFA